MMGWRGGGQEIAEIINESFQLSTWFQTVYHLDKNAIVFHFLPSLDQRPAYIRSLDGDWRHRQAFDNYNGACDDTERDMCGARCGLSCAVLRLRLRHAVATRTAAAALYRAPPTDCIAEYTAILCTDTRPRLAIQWIQRKG